MKRTAEQELQHAVETGDFTAVKKLLSGTHSRKDQYILDRALWSATVAGHLGIVDALLEAGANPNTKKFVGSLLRTAAARGHLNIVKRLVKAGADVHFKCTRRNAVTAALCSGHLAVAKYLKSLGVEWASPMLLYACEKGEVGLVKQAVAAGANIEMVGGVLEETPLMAAAGKGHASIVKFLLTKGAKVNRRSRGKTALYDAVAYGKDIETVVALLDAGAKVNDQWNGTTILMAAAENAGLPLVKLLVDRGANVHARDKVHGNNALDCAKAGKNKPVIEYLRSLGMTAERDAGRSLVKALGREFGGKPIEHSVGFMLNSKLAGAKCQFHVTPQDRSVAVFGLNYTDPELRGQEGLPFFISAEKPPPQRFKLERVSAAALAPGLMVHRGRGRNQLSEAFISRFCARHKRALQALRLSGQELVALCHAFARFAWSGMDFASLRPRLHAFASLLKEISGPSEPEHRLFGKEWRLKPLPGSGSTGVRGPGHRFGGGFEPPVQCPHCGARTNLMAELDLSDRALPRKASGLSKLPVFWCLECADWGPTFFELSSPTPKPIVAGRPVPRKSGLDAGAPDLDEQRLQLAPLAAGKTAGKRSKVGGGPDWLQLEQTPTCPKCRKRMAFVLQLASGPKISYGDVGLLYAFLCPECRVSASLVQSH